MGIVGFCFRAVFQKVAQKRRHKPALAPDKTYKMQEMKSSKQVQLKLLGKTFNNGRVI
ncbi:hypothetical protein FHS90_001872 [Rufibacter quisquiliarum]|uniref:Uncharacterized protein n=1 Tax=Rufibacter quisquiliarum TaxID=1549639 RepID=A0A839GTQ1_9BACT|nr:hypothetical protein [Rufibacter quisquiliarum]